MQATQFFMNNSQINDFMFNGSMPFCFNDCQGSFPSISPIFTAKNEQFWENEALRNSHDSTSQGSFWNQRYARFLR